MHIAEIARAMLNEKNLPNYFWAKAVVTIVYIMNRTPTTAIHGMTPKEKFTGKKPDVSHLRVFNIMATKVQIKKLLQAKEKKLNKIYMNVIQLS
jgi:hypothetical protein